MTDTTLFYLFSTVAQTVAAGVGFLAAFVLLRIQQWDALIAAHHAVVGRSTVVSAEDLAALYDACCKGDSATWERVTAHIEKAPSVGTAEEWFRGGAKDALAALFDLLPQRRQSLSQLYGALVVAAATIGFSLICITVTAWLVGRPLGIAAAVVALIGVASCAVCFGRVIVRSISPPIPPAKVSLGQKINADKARGQRTKEAES